MALTKCKECGNEISTKTTSCPKCGIKIDRTRPVFKVLGALLLILFAVAIFSPSDNRTIVQDAQEPASTDSAPEFSTTAKDIAAAYEKNTVSADNRFKGKRFEVSGFISDINTDIMGHAVIVVKGGVNEFMEPQAQLEDSERQKAASLVKGQKIAMICTGKGDIVKTPMMESCKIK